MTDPSRKHYARGRERRHELVMAAIDVIAERGIERVTFRSVAERAGFAPSTTSYFFDTVDSVIDAAITQVAESVTHEVRALVNRAADGMTLNDVAEAAIALVSPRDDAATTAQFEAYLAVRRRPGLQEPVARITAVIEAAAAEALEVLGVPDPQIPARQFVAVIDGFTLQQVAQPQSESVPAMMRDVLLRLLPTYLPDQPDGPIFDPAHIPPNDSGEEAATGPAKRGDGQSTTPGAS